LAFRRAAGPFLSDQPFQAAGKFRIDKLGSGTKVEYGIGDCRRPDAGKVGGILN
jgi:hypothetical protein